MSRIAVIGAGITGITTAHALLKRGYDVTVFDRHRYAAMGTSFANGGQLSASNAEVWTSLGTVLKGLKWMFRADAPLLFNPSPSWHKYSWAAEFLSNIPRYRRNTVETVRMAVAARDILAEMVETAGIAFDCERRGILHVYRNRDEFETATKVTALLAEGGLERRAVTPDEIAAIEPSLSADLYGGYYTESDFTGDIHSFTSGLAAHCERQGAKMVYGADVSLRHDTDAVTVRWGEDGTMSERFEKVVICAGTDSRGIAAGLGDRVNIYPVKGYSITVNLGTEADQAAAPWVSLLDDTAKIVTSRLGAGRFRVAGTAEFNGHNRDIRADRIDPLVQWCERFLPGMSTEHVVPWAGLRPMMPSMLPRVGAGRKSGVFYNTGHGHLGWTLSAFTAEAVAETILTADRGSRVHPSVSLDLKDA